ncbi:MAG: hypothetical protein NW220_14730 [Leptolyngbyaceae cyanobacterium bins.349]|nr:hypothetical protein [Leptolyngbyaceae cyanobacterium bins.349]
MKRTAILTILLFLASCSNSTSQNSSQSSPTSPSSSLITSEAPIKQGEKVFTSLKGIYETAGEATTTPVVRVIIPQTGWKNLAKSDQISLTMYAESLVSVVKSNPSKYVSIPSSAPAHNTFVSKIANLCQDCWSIVVSYKDSQPYGIDETIVQGDTPWISDDPCCRGIKSSEFRK